ncbi:MAG: HAD family hydrolase [Gammaproteobacteria bacterium]
MAINQKTNSIPNVVIFDLFGTLIEFGEMHHPFRTLMKWARENGRTPHRDDARFLMTRNLPVKELAYSMGIDAPKKLLQKINDDIEVELNSLKLYNDVNAVFDRLTQKNISIVICSNLAKPYGRAIELLPSDIPCLLCMSYEVGFIKPDPEIYQWILDKKGVGAPQCLFVGDTLLADYDGPLSSGMNACHLIRGATLQKGKITSLMDILQIFDN